MVPRPPVQSTALFKIVAFSLIAINVIWHGIVALFLGGPLGLGVFLLMVMVVWVGSWVTMLRWHEASADEGPDPSRPDEVEEHDHDSVGTGVG